MEGIIVEQTTDGIILWYGLAIAQNAILSCESTFINDLEGMVKYALASLFRNPHNAIGWVLLFQEEMDEVQAVILIRGKPLITLVLHVLSG